ncbi:hypothetical protein [Marichromatium sp. AB31]|uniref:hypothetical protein n=1 Tax=Marichromatium sp. AB31 TaxID=2483362 RepID=UPI000F400BE3|nr:hypothetical protein [Marichromatium sp. AB31]RNE92199.1 hypothetical protein EBL84_01870 [Marichromatium sp. AB31]
MALQTFDQEYYLQQNPDVLQAILQGAFTSAEQHYTLYGEAEGRQPNPYFEPTGYYTQNPDVLAAVQAGSFSSALQHYELYGATEGRQPGADTFNEATYLADNPDVQAAVDAGTFTSGYQHFVLFGAAEGRASGGSESPSTGETFTLTTEAGEIITGTAGDDTFNALVGTGATLNAFDAIDGRGGNDTANIVADASVTAAQLGQFSNVETYVIKQSGTQASTDVSGISSLKSLDVQGIITQAAQFTVGEGVTIKLAADATDNDIDVIAAKDVTALNIISGDTDTDAVVTSETNASVKTVTVSGETSGTVAVTATASTETLNLDLSEDVALTVAGGALETLNMSASTGDISVTLLANITSVTGGSGSDTITDKTGASTLATDLGAGNDTFVIAAGDATETVSITLGAGNDTVDVNALANADADALADTMITITDFSAANDVLDLSGLDGGGTAVYNSLNNTQLGNIAAEDNLEDAAAAAEALLGGADGFTAFNYGGNAYILKGDGNGGLDDADGIIQLTGVSLDNFDGSNFITA